MSSKRIWWITAFGAAIIVCVFVVISLFSYFKNRPTEIILPETNSVTDENVSSDGTGLDRIIITPDNVQYVIENTLTRPTKYTRDIVIESFWEGGSAVYNITTAISGKTVSLRAMSLSGGYEKRIIITQDKLYIWYQGESAYYEGNPNSNGDELRTSDEWQMMLTYEDILDLEIDDILDAGYTQYNGENCIYVVFKSPLLGYTTKCYISIEYGLIIGAEEYDDTSAVSVMTTGSCILEEPDKSFFILPDGTELEIT